jgi:hypothetical protein
MKNGKNHEARAPRKKLKIEKHTLRDLQPTDRDESVRAGASSKILSRSKSQATGFQTYSFTSAT